MGGSGKNPQRQKVAASEPAGPKTSGMRPSASASGRSSPTKGGAERAKTHTRAASASATKPKRSKTASSKAVTSKSSPPKRRATKTIPAPAREATAAARTTRAARPEPSTAEPGRRLDWILRALPPRELQSLISRMGIRTDAAKRIDVPSQVARALCGIPDVRDTSRLPSASRELLCRIAEAGGMLRVAQLPMGLETLVVRGIVFARQLDDDHGPVIELVLPTAYLLQLHSWEGEDPRSMRALLAQTSLETMTAIASNYLGRPATPPIAIALETAWEVLSDETRLREEVETLAPVERRLLAAVDGVGGEVDTEELLDLEREPLRLRGVAGVSASRRGAGFALERRGFLIPMHPNRHLIPTEVARVVGAERRQRGVDQRARVRSFVLEEDHAPRRARFARDPGPVAMAMAIAARESGTEVRAGVGTPRSLLTRMAQRFGRPVETASLVASLSRAIGLWESSALSAAAPPGAMRISDLTVLLFAAWRRGGAWDEARPEPEVLRSPADARDPSPSRSLRELALDALRDLGEGRWVPWSALVDYLAADPRLEGIERLLRRWAERVGVPAPQPVDVLRSIILETLPALGIVDLGVIDSDLVDSNLLDSNTPDAEVTLRLTPRGRAVLAGATSGEATAAEPPRGTAGESGASHFLDTQALRVGPEGVVGHVLSLASFAEIGRVEDQLDLLLTPTSLARALSAGLDGEAMRARIEAVAPLPDSISRMLSQASAVLGRATLVGASGFLWVDDPEIRELLRSRRTTAELFVDPSPLGGLLVAEDVDGDRLARRCRALGVEISAEGGLLRAKAGASRAGDSARATARPRSRSAGPRSK